MKKEMLQLLEEAYNAGRNNPIKSENDIMKEFIDFGKNSPAEPSFINWWVMKEASMPLDKPTKKITVSLMRSLEKQVLKGDISYSKMIEILNETIS